MKKGVKKGMKKTMKKTFFVFLAESDYLEHFWKSKFFPDFSRIFPWTFPIFV